MAATSACLGGNICRQGWPPLLGASSAPLLPPCFLPILDNRYTFLHRIPSNQLIERNRGNCSTRKGSQAKSLLASLAHSSCIPPS